MQDGAGIENGQMENEIFTIERQLSLSASIILQPNIQLINPIFNCLNQGHKVNFAIELQNKKVADEVTHESLFSSFI